MRKLILCLLTCLSLTACTVGIARRDEFLPEATGTSSPTPPPTATETATPTATRTPFPTDTATSPPTDTPPPPSATPTSPPPRPTKPPTATPTEAPSPTPCALAIGPAFQSRLGGRAGTASALGCPASEQQQTQAAEQAFQHGRMFWRDDTDNIYILYNDSRTFQITDDPYVEGDPADACPEVGDAPAGLYKPVRGFNRQWCNVPGARDGLGWALEPEAAYDADWQAFAHGLVIMSRANHIFALHDEGTWEYVE
jgi:hypothetical protein